MRTRPLLLTFVVALLATLPAAFAQAPQQPAPPAIPPAAPAPTPAPVQAPAAAPVQAPAVAPTQAPATALPPDASKLADKPAAPEVAVKGDDAAAKGVATKSKDSAGKDTLSVDFPDEDIRNILRNVADLFELNLVMPDTLQGKTSIKLRDVTWRQIFQNVLTPVNYTAVEDGNIIKIVSNDSLNDEPVVTEVFPINYATAALIMPAISSQVDPPKGKIIVDARSNSLVITERPTRLQRIRPIIAALDKPTDQVMIESKFVEVTNSDIKNLGVDWSSLANFKLNAGGFTGAFDRTRAQNLTDGSSVNQSNATTTTAGTNANNTTGTNGSQTNGSNTTSTVTSTNGSPTATSTTGVNGALTNTTTTATVDGTTNQVANTLGNTLTNLLSIANTGATNRSAQAVFSASDFSVVLSALQTLNDVKIVSNPTIVTLNNTEATINIGSEFPVPSYAYNEQRGSFEVSNFTYKAIGINLKVTPQVNGAGFIKLSLEPEVSQQNGSTSFGGAGGASIPIIASRKAKTTVSLRDGFTMGIGGLLTEQTTKGGNQIPLLGSIPVLGRLFRSDSVNKQMTNLIIFITAKTISAEGASVEQVFESGRVRELQLHREDLPGYRDGSSPFLPTPPKPGELNSGENPPAKKSFFHLGSPDDKK